MWRGVEKEMAHCAERVALAIMSFSLASTSTIALSISPHLPYITARSILDSAEQQCVERSVDSHDPLSNQSIYPVRGEVVFRSCSAREECVVDASGSFELALHRGDLAPYQRKDI
jgi:hypothetical protein